MSLSCGKDLPPAPLGDGRGEVPGGDLGANTFAVERASARRGVGQPPHVVLMKQGIGLPYALVRRLRCCRIPGARFDSMFPFRSWEKDEMLLSCSRTYLALPLMQTWVHSHLKVTVLTRRRIHLKSSKLFHLGKFHAVRRRVQAAHRAKVCSRTRVSIT